MSSLGLRQVLRNRIEVYENSYDIRVTVADGDTPTVIAEKVVKVMSCDFSRKSWAVDVSFLVLYSCS